MLVRLLERGLWIDSGDSGSADASLVDSDELRRLALDTALVPPGSEVLQHILTQVVTARRSWER
jgi:hypothetical protein